MKGVGSQETPGKFKHKRSELHANKNRRDYDDDDDDDDEEEDSDDDDFNDTQSDSFKRPPRVESNRKFANEEQVGEGEELEEYSAVNDADILDEDEDVDLDFEEHDMGIKKEPKIRIKNDRPKRSTQKVLTRAEQDAAFDETLRKIELHDTIYCKGDTYQ